jgi:hypothetical protein
MIDINEWLAVSDSMGAALVEERAVTAWARVQDKPASIVVLRGAAERPAQTVRIETETNDRSATGPGGTTYQIDAVVYGVKDHPDEEVLDTDLQPGDQFALGGRQYEVIAAAVETPGHVQVYCRVRL